MSIAFPVATSPLPSTFTFMIHALMRWCADTPAVEERSPTNDLYISRSCPSTSFFPSLCLAFFTAVLYWFQCVMHHGTPSAS